MISIFRDLHFGSPLVLLYEAQSSPYFLLGQVPQFLECCAEMLAHSQWQVVCHPDFFLTFKFLLALLSFSLKELYLSFNLPTIISSQKTQPQH